MRKVQAQLAILGMRKTGSHVGKKKTTGRHRKQQAYSGRSAFPTWRISPSLCYHSFQVVISLCPSLDVAIVQGSFEW